MQINDLIKIGRAKRRDARAAKTFALISRGFYEGIERLSIEIVGAKSLESFDNIIDKVCLFSEREFNYSRLVMKAIEDVYQKYQREEKQNPGMDLQWLNSIRRYGLSLQMKREFSESLQSFRKKYHQWRQDKISREQLLSATRTLKGFGGKYAN